MRCVAAPTGGFPGFPGGFRTSFTLIPSLFPTTPTRANSPSQPRRQAGSPASQVASVRQIHLPPSPTLPITELKLKLLHSCADRWLPYPSKRRSVPHGWIPWLPRWRAAEADGWVP
jgi:hypothetical protein